MQGLQGILKTPIDALTGTAATAASDEDDDEDDDDGGACRFAGSKSSAALTELCSAKSYLTSKQFVDLSGSFDPLITTK